MFRRENLDLKDRIPFDRPTCHSHAISRKQFRPASATTRHSGLSCCARVFSAWSLETCNGQDRSRDYINATIGFEELSELTGKPAKSLMRMMGPGGNPTARNLLEVVAHLQKAEGLRFELSKPGSAFLRRPATNTWRLIDHDASRAGLAWELNPHQCGPHPSPSAHDDVPPGAGASAARRPCLPSGRSGRARPSFHRSARR